MTQEPPVRDSLHASPSQRQSRLFIAWEPSNSRSETLAREFGADCLFIHYLSLKRPWLAPAKYLLQSMATAAALFRRRPDVVFVQNPPVFAPLVAWLYCRLRRKRLIVDSHSGVFFEKKWLVFESLHRFVARRATVNVVTNDHLAERIGRWGAAAYVIPDVPVHAAQAAPLPDRPERLVTVINTFSYDEPLDEILDAARRLPEIDFRVTGDTARAPAKLVREAPANVTFTGFMPRQSYLDTVAASDGVIVLTRENHTMQRGAYEAVALGVPVITSDWPLLRRTFSRGTLYVDNSAAQIREAVATLMADRDRLAGEIRSLRRDRRVRWRERRSDFDGRYLSAPVPAKAAIDVTA